MLGFIRITVDEEDGDFELRLNFSKDGFSGEGMAYFSARELQGFCKDLIRYPMVAPFPSLKGGHWRSNETSKVLALETLGVWVDSVDSHGYAVLKILVAKPQDNRDDFRWSHTASVEFRVSYEQLCRISKDLEMLISGRAEEVVVREEC